MKRAFLVFGLCAGLLACQRSTFDEQPIEVAGLTLTTSEVAYDEWFTAGDDLLRAPASKVTEVNFQAKDTIGVFIYSGALGNGSYHSTNMRYYTKDGTPDASTSPKWTAATAMGGALVAGTAYSSTAYYPYQTTATNASAVVHSVATDQSSTAVVAGSSTALERSDFMWAPPVSVIKPTEAPAATMVFQHLLTKLVVSVQVPSMIGGVAVTKLKSIAIKNLNTTASVNLGTGELHSLTNAQDIKPRLLSGNGNPGTVSTYEAVVVSQTAASGVVLVELNCQTANGDKVANYFPPAAGLALGSGKKITLTLTSAADIAITSELDLVTGQAYNNLPLTLKVASGVAWTLTAPTGSWITLATASGGTYGLSVSGTGSGGTQTVFVNAAANTGTTPRQTVLTLAATIGGTARSVTYTAVQNYSQPVVSFPTRSVMMQGESYELDKVVGNSNWYIKADNLPQGVRLSRRNVTYDKLVAADTIALHSLSTTGTKIGYLVSGNYYNSNGALYVVMDPANLSLFSLVCNGVTVAIETRIVQVGALKIAKGNLIASNSVAGARGAGGCRVGAHADGGLYFQFGSLIGYKGGNQANGGTGVGMPQAPLTAGGKFWNGVKYDWNDDAMVWPTGMAGTKTKWENTTGGSIATLSDYYFNYSSGDWGNANSTSADIGTFDVTVADEGSTTGNLRGGRYANLGVGDPCTYYLGTPWRLPTTSEQASITGVTGSSWIEWKTEGVTGRWATAGDTFGSVTGPGAWLGKPLISGTGTPSSSANVFFPASGLRHSLDGSIHNVTSNGNGWSSSVSYATNGYLLYVHGSAGVIPQLSHERSYGFPVRCVVD